MPGLRDPGLLDSALAQPFQTFGGVDLYPTLAQKAARYAWGIARFKPRHDELYDAMVGVAEGTWGFEELAAWVEGNVPAGAGGM